jgi:hypothetical protein
MIPVAMRFKERKASSQENDGIAVLNTDQAMSVCVHFLSPTVTRQIIIPHY